MKNYLVGDIGATRLRLARATVTNEKDIGSELGGQFSISDIEILPSKDFDTLATGVQRYLSAYERKAYERESNKREYNGACFGVPGPVIDGTVQVTNLPWHLDERELTAELKFPVKLINDLVALGASISALNSERVITLHAGKSQVGKHNNLAESTVVLAPGTGLGQCYAVRIGESKEVFSAEGGHVGFAPQSEIEDELLVYLRAKFGHVSYERIISGPGLLNIYEFLIEAKKMRESSEVRARMRVEDPSKVISELALAYQDSACERALDLFTLILAARAGDLALSFLPHGGVYLGGGIPRRILPYLDRPEFIKSYLAKGRLSYVVERIPVFVITEATAALIGAAVLAEEGR